MARKVVFLPLCGILALCVFVSGLQAAGTPAKAPVQPPQARVHTEEMTWVEVRDAIAAGKTTAIIYFGSTEQSGPHMVLGRHTIIARYLAGEVARRLGNALVYPVLPVAPTGPFSTSGGHLAFPGTVSLYDETYARLASDVARSALIAGFRLVVVMGDHGGGQYTLKRATEALDLEARTHGAKVRYVPDVYFKARELARAELLRLKLPVGTHADIVDTSELMYLDTAGTLVRRNRMELGNERNGVEGDPRRATAELGRRFLEYKVSIAVDRILAAAQE